MFLPHSRCIILLMKIELMAFTRCGIVHRLVVTVLVLLVSACATMPPPALQDEPPNWTVKFDRPIEFQMLVDDELLVVGTIRHLYGISPKTGNTLWRQRNITVTSNNLTLLGEGSYVLVNDAAGGVFDDRDTNILALERESGEIVWESSLLKGKILQGALDDSREVLFFTTVLNAHGDDRGFLSGTFGRKGLGSGFKQKPYLSALEVSTGRLLWTQPFPKSVLMRPSQRKQLDEKADWSYTRPFDLGLYHPPLLAGGLVCLTYDGIHCFNAKTGKPVWKDRFSVLEDELALSYAYPVVDDTTIITTGGHRVRAYDLVTGKRLWKSEKFDIIPELLLGSQILYGQLGGQFFNIDKEKWKWQGDFGVFALDKASGETIWIYAEADDAMTNVLVYGDEIWLADEKYLIALDRFDGTLRFRIKHEFDDPPVYAALNELQEILLIGDGEAAAFDPDLGTSIWHVRHAPVGPGAWRRFSTGLLHTTGNILKFSSFVLSHGVGLLPSLVLPIGGVNFKVINTKKIVSTPMGRAGRRMTYHTGPSERGVGNANLSGNFQYFVTRPKGLKQVVLAVVNLSSGQTERLIRMDADHPNLVIDEGNGKIYETFDHQLMALSLATDGSMHRALSQQSGP